MYLNDWSSIEDMKNDFFYSTKKYENEFDGINVLLASYGCANYSGDAFVLFEKDGKLYEVNGSHCSCYDLEGQWDPEETTKEDLMKRIQDGNLGDDDYCDNIFKDKLLEVLSKL